MSTTNKPQFEVVAPVFGVTDALRSSAYYVDQLAFEIGFEWSDAEDEHPRYIIVNKGNTELHLSQTQSPQLSTAYFFIDGVQDYYNEIKTSNAIITEHIADYPWDMREFEVKDLDGNTLVFGEHLSRLKN